ncbi:MAG: flagellar cap protein FliD N-terminal domain-containing protein, partial [Campylobacterota bacterium]|nr:flagellar cap protein FliD N-terminal domain-containing protein [Campylobacterota bacterium]
MGISSLGVGSSILTQDVLDQLRAADEAGQIKPIELSLANEGDKKAALKLIDASMTNLIDSINEIKSQSLYDERKTEVSGTSVEVTASANSDVQDFTLNVTTLATKQIEQSGSFGSEDDLVGSGGQINLNIDGEDFTIDYTASTTLKELKNLINDVAGEKVDATVVQIGSSDFRLFISSADTGTTQDITITDVTGTIDSKLSTDFDLAAIQSG